MSLAYVHHKGHELPSEIVRHTVSKRLVIPLYDILMGLDVKLASVWDRDDVYDNEDTDIKQRISVALNTALRLWSASGWRLMPLIQQQLPLSAIKSKLLSDTDTRDIALGVADSLVWSLFTALVPYMCHTSADDLIVDTICWSENLAKDPILDVQYIRIY